MTSMGTFVVGETLDQIWAELVERVMGPDASEHDSRNGNTRELLGVNLTLRDPRAGWLESSVRDMSPIYAAGEFLWYLSLENKGDFITHYAPHYKRFLNDGIAWGGYGERMGTQLQDVIGLLRDKPNTRQAIIQLWSSRAKQDLVHARLGDKNDIPCTLGMQFLMRDGRLHCIVTMRSNDIWLGLPYDVFCFTNLQCLIAEFLDVEVGEYQHNVGSMHVYTKDLSKTANLNLSDVPTTDPVLFTNKNYSWYLIDRYLDVERAYRLWSSETIPVPRLDDVMHERSLPAGSRLSALGALASLQSIPLKEEGSDPMFEYIPEAWRESALRWQEKIRARD